MLKKEIDYVLNVKRLLFCKISEGKLAFKLIPIEGSDFALICENVYKRGVEFRYSTRSILIFGGKIISLCFKLSARSFSALCGSKLKKNNNKK